MRLVQKHFNELSTEQLYRILMTRCTVFVVEQRNPYQDIDMIDRNSIHLFLEDRDAILAYARVFRDDTGTAHIGRVLATVRGKGYGAKIMTTAIDACRQEFDAKTIVLESQCTVSGFYAKYGFKIASDVFDENGIPHVLMKWDLQTSS